MQSLKSCPIEYSHPEEATVLAGIGPKTVQRLIEDLKAHCERTGWEMPERGECCVLGYGSEGGNLFH